MGIMLTVLESQVLVVVQYKSIWIQMVLEVVEEVMA